MRYIDDVGDLKGKTVFLRTDFDVPVVNGSIGEPFRIERQKENLRYLLDHGARVVMAAHISAVPSFEPLVPELGKILEVNIDFKTGDGPVVLLENLRTNPGEEANDKSYAQQLIAGYDLYVNNSFAVCHREHASVATAPLLIPSFGGLLLREETTRLQQVIDAPAKGKVIIMGGAKASTKVPVIRHILDKAEHIAIGGVLANDILKELGSDIGNSRVDEDAHELLAGLDLHDPRLVLPTDFVKDNGQILDLGPESARAFAALTRNALLIVWNGPVGRFEDERFMPGTEAIARAMAGSSAQTVIGGGDTIKAVDTLGLLGKYSFVSTGGGAMLAFLSGIELPGLKALGYYASIHP